MPISTQCSTRLAAPGILNTSLASNGLPTMSGLSSDRVVRIKNRLSFLFPMVETRVHRNIASCNETFDRHERVKGVDYVSRNDAGLGQV